MIGPEFWIAMAVWVIAFSGVVALVFAILLFLRLYSLANHIDKILYGLGSNLSPLTTQTHRTLESIELAALHISSMLKKLDAPVSRIHAISEKTTSPFLSPQMIAAIIGFIRGVRTFRKWFHRGKREDRSGN